MNSDRHPAGHSPRSWASCIMLWILRPFRVGAGARACSRRAAQKIAGEFAEARTPQGGGRRSSRRSYEQELRGIEAQARQRMQEAVAEGQKVAAEIQRAGAARGAGTAWQPRRRTRSRASARRRRSCSRSRSIAARRCAPPRRSCARSSTTPAQRKLVGRVHRRGGGAAVKDATVAGALRPGALHRHREARRDRRARSRT